MWINLGDLRPSALPPHVYNDLIYYFCCHTAGMVWWQAQSPSFASEWSIEGLDPCLWLAGKEWAELMDVWSIPSPKPFITLLVQDMTLLAIEFASQQEYLTVTWRFSYSFPLDAWKNWQSCISRKLLLPIPIGNNCWECSLSDQKLD